MGEESKPFICMNGSHRFESNPGLCHECMGIWLRRMFGIAHRPEKPERTGNDSERMG